MVEAQARRVQEQAGQRKARAVETVEPALAEGRVAEHVVTEVVEVSADLVAAPGEDARAHERAPGEAQQRAEFGVRRARLAALVGQRTLRREAGGRLAAHEGEVVLAAARRREAALQRRGRG